MAAGNDPLEDQPQQLQEEVARLRADNRRLLAELEQLAAGDRGPGRDRSRPTHYPPRPIRLAREPPRAAGSRR